MYRRVVARSSAGGMGALIMGRDLHAGGGIAHPVFQQFKLLPELLVMQQSLVQALRLPIEHVAQLLNRPLQVGALELQRL